MDSLWKVGIKHRWWRAIKGGDLMIFVAALGLLNAVYELRVTAIEDRGMRTVVRLLRGDAEVGLGGQDERVSRKKSV